MRLSKISIQKEIKILIGLEFSGLEIPFFDIIKKMRFPSIEKYIMKSVMSKTKLGYIGKFVIDTINELAGGSSYQKAYSHFLEV
jgi:hypothetical protein